MVAQNYECCRTSIPKSYAAVRRTNGIVSRHVCALLRFSNVIGSALRIQYRLHSCHNEKLLRLIDNMLSNRKNHIQKHCHSHCPPVGQIASNQCCTVSHRFIIMCSSAVFRELKSYCVSRKSRCFDLANTWGVRARARRALRTHVICHFRVIVCIIACLDKTAIINDELMMHNGPVDGERADFFFASFCRYRQIDFVNASVIEEVSNSLRRHIFSILAPDLIGSMMNEEISIFYILQSNNRTNWIFS